MTTTITVLLILGLAAWMAGYWYGRHWWAARKWEEEQRRARKYQRMEERKTRKIARLKFEEAAEQFRRQRTGENRIYEDAQEKRDTDIIRRGIKRRDAQSGGSPSKEWDLS